MWRNLYYHWAICTSDFIDNVLKIIIVVIGKCSINGIRLLAGKTVDSIIARQSCVIGH